MSDDLKKFETAYDALPEDGDLESIIQFLGMVVTAYAEDSGEALQMLYTLTGDLRQYYAENAPPCMCEHCVAERKRQVN